MAEDERVSISVQRGWSVDLVARLERSHAGGARIVVARLDREGVSLDPEGLVLSEGATSAPGIGFDGENFLVAWNAYGVVRAARVSEAGVVLDPGGFVVANANLSSGRPAVVFGAGSYLVVWASVPDWFQRRPDQGIWGARVTRSGHLGAGPFLIFADPYWETFTFQPAVSDVSVAWSGELFLVAWIQRLREVGPFCGLNGCAATTARALRLNAGGDVLDSAPIELSSGRLERETAVASDGSGFLVAWTNRPYLLSPKVMLARVDSAGGVVSAPTIGSGRHPSVRWNGRRYVIGWVAGKFLPETYAIETPPEVLMTFREADGLAPPEAPFGSAWFITHSEHPEISAELAVHEERVTVAYERITEAGASLYSRVVDMHTLPPLPAPPDDVQFGRLAVDRCDVLLSWTGGPPVGGYAILEELDDQWRSVWTGGELEHWLRSSVDSTGRSRTRWCGLPKGRFFLRSATAVGVSGYSAPADPVLLLDRARPALGR